MSRSLLEKEFVAEAAINPYRIVKFGSSDDTMLQGAAATDALMGIVEGVAPAIGERCAVVTHGIGEVKLGGTVVRGGPLTSDASGQAIAAAPAAGNNVRIIGFAMQSGVLGDVINATVAPGLMQG